MKERILSISEAAKQLGVETHVLRYWEEELEIPIPRNEMGYRLYGAKQMHLLHTVKELKMQGFQLRAIKLLLNELNSNEEINIEKILAMREKMNEKVNQLPSEESLDQLMSQIGSSESHAAKSNGFAVNNQLMSQIGSSESHAAKSNGFAVNNQLMSQIGSSESHAAKSNGFAVNNQLMSQIGSSESHAAKSKGFAADDQLMNKTSSSGAFPSKNDKNLEKALYHPREKDVYENQTDDGRKQFHYAMMNIMNEALQENNISMTHQFQGMIQKTLSEELLRRLVSSMEQVIGDHISDEVSTRVIKELNYLSRSQEEREEEQFRKLEEMFDIMKGNVSAKQRRKLKKEEQKMVAAAKADGKKKSKLLWF